ncbi:helix-hairpin-helix domain-containing protein [Pelomonas sp. KK5]|uniref:helix-hairpin-helix domain-containing protein n=1 Tax=Pelomonas sp. KK5 TaxID=1855730 RepID=UPI00097C0E7E|nr:helix-hairpin-helix domain-containing protein [Pelomonas sp. KK5]
MKKAASHEQCTELQQIPNIGPAMAEDLRQMGLARPTDLRGRDPLTLYRQLCKLSGQRQDPCVLDTFMAAVDFMNGAAAAPWWHYTARRKAAYGQVD